MNSKQLTDSKIRKSMIEALEGLTDCQSDYLNNKIDLEKFKQNCKLY